MTFIVMEFVEGRTLRSVLAEGRLTVPDALRIGSEIVEGMVRAHEARVIHRDLKPDNVLIDAEGRVRILDLGLARILQEPAPADAHADEVITQEPDAPDRIVGTAMYMSPEQARGEKTDPRSDIFSFGIVLYEMLAGVPPFAGRNATTTVAKILEASADPLDRHVPGLPDAVEELVGRCLE